MGNRERGERSEWQLDHPRVDKHVDVGRAGTAGEKGDLAQDGGRIQSRDGLATVALGHAHGDLPGTKHEQHLVARTLRQEPGTGGQRPFVTARGDGGAILGSEEAERRHACEKRLQIVHVTKRNRARTTRRGTCCPAGAHLIAVPPTRAIWYRTPVPHSGAGILAALRALPAA